MAFDFKFNFNKEQTAEADAPAQTANTNPRIEQASIVTERSLYEFYREFFDGINSFTKTDK